MIHYPITLRDLARIVSKHLPTRRNRDGTLRKNAKKAWRVRAHEQTRQLRIHGKDALDEQNEIWSELQGIFAWHQGNDKCAYCEKKLDLRKSDRADGDIEHYRPKKGVEGWPTAHPIPVGGQDSDCYYLLAFHLRNYLLVCHTCNQDYKGNYFPIAGPRCSADSVRPRNLKDELPYLPNPLDPDDDDPEQLIEFIGNTPVPRAEPDTRAYWRAVVTIEMLGLDGRSDLNYDRALVLSNLYQALISADPTNPVVVRTLNALQDSTSKHLNCARSFKRLYDQDPMLATNIITQALKHIDDVQKRRRQHYA